MGVKNSVSAVKPPRLRAQPQPGRMRKEPRASRLSPPRPGAGAELHFPWCPGAPRRATGWAGRKGRCRRRRGAAPSPRPNGGAEVRGVGGHGQRGGAAAGLGGAHHQGRLGLLREVREGGGASTPAALRPHAPSPWGSAHGAAAAAPSARGGQETPFPALYLRGELPPLAGGGRSWSRAPWRYRSACDSVSLLLPGSGERGLGPAGVPAG